MSKKLIFLGSSQNISRVADIARINGFEVLGIVDNDYFLNTDSINGIPFIGTENNLTQLYERIGTTDVSFFIGVNTTVESNESQKRTNAKRKKLINFVEKNNLDIVNIIDPTAIIPETVKLGKGIYITQYTVIQNSVTISDYCCIKELVCIAHDSKIGKNVTLSTGSYVGSHVTIGENSYIGIQSCCLSNNIENLIIGKNCVTHPGTIILKNLADNSTATMGQGRLRGTYGKTLIN